MPSRISNIAWIESIVYKYKYLIFSSLNGEGELKDGATPLGEVG